MEQTEKYCGQAKHFRPATIVRWLNDFIRAIQRGDLPETNGSVEAYLWNKKRVKIVREWMQTLVTTGFYERRHKMQTKLY